MATIASGTAAHSRPRPPLDARRAAVWNAGAIVVVWLTSLFVVALWVAGGSTTEVKLQSTLFAGNTHGNANMLFDLYRDNGGSQSTIDASNSSFQTQPDVAMLNGTVTATMFDTDPGLEALDESGLTPIHPLPQTSPVIDHGSNPASLPTDQRGAPRACASTEGGQAVTDIGAYEYRTDRIFFGDFEAH